MNREPGYYWVKLKGLIQTGWIVSEWWDKKGEIFKDGFWKIDSSMFADTNMAAINETRILMPGEVNPIFKQIESKINDRCDKLSALGRHKEIEGLLPATIIAHDVIYGTNHLIDP